MPVHRDGRERRLLARNPHLRYGLGGRCDDARVELATQAAAIAFRAVYSVKASASGIATAARFAVEAGRPGVVAAWLFDPGECPFDRLKLGEYGGRYRSLAPAALNLRRTALASWLPRLSTTTMSPCRSTGTWRARPTPVLL